MAGKAELKISAIIIFHVLTGILGLIGAAYAINNRVTIQQDIIEFFLCPASNDPSANCADSLKQVSRLYAVLDTTFIMISFMPVVLLFFGMNFKTCQEKLHLKCPQCFHRWSSCTLCPCNPLSSAHSLPTKNPVAKEQITSATSLSA